MASVILFFCRAFGLVTALFGLYFAALAVGLLRRPAPVPPTERRLRFAVLVPARNEEACIGGIVESIRRQDYPPELVDVYVIPNNCTDRTADAARAAGAQILSVSSAVRSKGQALHEAFDYLLREERHDAYCVFDADNEADPAFLQEMNAALVGGARAAKSRILAKNPHESWVCACYDVYFCNANRFLNQARAGLSLSARLIGTGFAVRRDLMEELGGWNTHTLTEDAEFFALLSARGEPIAFVPGAVTYDEEPLTFRESLTQRRRWMSGVMEVGRLSSRPLLRAIRSGPGRRRALDAWLQLTFTRLQAWLLPVFLLQVLAAPADTLSALPLGILQFYAGGFFMGLISLLLEGRLTRRTAAALLCYPLFLFSFFPLQTLSLLRPNRAWKPIRHTGVRLTRPAVSAKKA